jgi:DNA-directed RNA polymerase subunit M/transcription elongation factor TFIIS
MSSRAEPSSGRRKKSIKIVKKKDKTYSEDEDSLVKEFNIDPKFMSLKYKNDTYGFIFDHNRRNVLIELLGMLKSLPEEDVYNFLQTVETPNDILWKQPLLEKAKEALEREIFILRSSDIVVKGGGKCKYCQSESVGFVEMQTRSGDESLSQFYRCADCQKTWRQ